MPYLKKKKANRSRKKKGVSGKGTLLGKPEKGGMKLFKTVSQKGNVSISAFPFVHS